MSVVIISNKIETTGRVIRRGSSMDFIRQQRVE